MALWIMSGATRVSRYQKNHSPTHIHRGHQISVSASSIYCDPWHPPYSIHVLYSLFPQFGDIQFRNLRDYEGRNCNFAKPTAWLHPTMYTIFIIASNTMLETAKFFLYFVLLSYYKNSWWNFHYYADRTL